MLVDVLESKNNILKFRQKLMTQPHRFSFYSADDDSLKFMAVQQQGQIVGVLAFKDQSDYDPDYMEQSYCEVLSSHRGKGIGAALVRELMTMASARSCPIFVTAYEEDGLQALKPIIDIESKKLGVHVLEQGSAYDIANDPSLW